MDKELEQMLKEHAAIVEKAAASYRAMINAQTAHSKNREAEHESAEKIAKYLEDQLEPTLKEIDPVYYPVSIDVDLGSDRGRRNLKKLMQTKGK